MKDNAVFIADVIDAIIATGELDAINWSEFSMVFGFDSAGEANETYGYAYEPTGKWHSFSVTPRDVRTEVNAYEKFVRGDYEHPMVKLLFQFNRDSGRFSSDFEFDNDERWKIAPDSFKETIVALIPNLD